jgi:4-aminobutyrate aminotransferase-like enzyme
LLANARERAAQLMAGLQALAARHRVIGDVRGLGLFIGVEFVKDRATLQPDADALKRTIEGMKSAGVLLSSEGPRHNVLKIKPPLVITAAECSQFLDTLAQTLRELGL